MLDIKIFNGKIVDGTGRECFKADIGIDGDKISAIGNLGDRKATKIIDAEQKIICPGFIDVHSHSDLMLIKNPVAHRKIKQGVTTEIVGNCGLSLVPKNQMYEEELKNYVGPLLGGRSGDWECKTLGDYFKLIEKKGINVNMCSYVAHGSVRLAVMGFENRKPSLNELKNMKSLVAKAMEDGAIGLTTGLVYPPGSYANNEEIIELCSVVAKYNGIYTSHVRNEADEILKAYNEAIDVARELNMPVNISHHKINNPEYCGKSVETIFLLTQARVEGLQITCDQYPYKSASTIATVLCPPWSLENGLGGLMEILKDREKRDRIKQNFINGLSGWQCLVKDVGWRNIFIAGVENEDNKHLEGKTFAEAASENKQQPPDLFFDLMLQEEGQVIMIAKQQLEEDFRRIMKYPYTMFGTDGIFTGNPHPRLTNSFPRILGRYVREHNVLRMEEAIRKMTSLPAKVFGLDKVGKIEKGYSADIIIFDPEKVVDCGSYTEPEIGPKGIEKVIVNGKIAKENGEVKEALSGKIFKNIRR